MCGRQVGTGQSGNYNALTGMRFSGSAVGSRKAVAGCGAGWHRVTFYGDLKEPVIELCDRLKLKPIEEA